MTILQNTKIATKIISLLALLGALTIAVGWIGSSRLRDSDATYSDLVNKLTGGIKLTQVNRRIALMDASAYQAISYDGASAQSKAALLAEKEAYESGLVRLETAEKLVPAWKEEIAKFRNSLEELHALTGEAARLGVANRNDEARKVIEQADLAAISFAKELTKFNESTIAAADAESQELSSNAATTSWTVQIASIAGAIIGIVISILVARVGITGPLTRLKSAMETLAEGNTAAEIDGTDRRDEVGDMAKVVQVFRETAIAKAAADADKASADAAVQMVVSTMSANLTDLSNRDLTSRVTADFPADYVLLKDSFNEAIDQVRTTVQLVTESAANIRTGANEIAQASEDLARRTEGNAASLEETSAALVQIDTRLKATALSSGQTVARADQAIATVGGGRATADEAVQAMGRVSDSAKGIDSVIEGLDKIAFQTRVLAMNAAVEAGRAGDAGRGFAVVADLVSALAMRAEEEAKRARDQLTLTQTDIVTAVQAVQKVDGALANISSDVGEVHTLLGAMADDATAQSSAITQISAAISAMDQSTQQNAAMVEETSAAARNLTTEVSSLAAQAAMFTTGEGRSAPTLKSPVAPPRSAAPKMTKKATAAYRSPVKALPAMAGSDGGDDDWNAF
ncbi:methyl-accepting chemotaxis sensory transducer [Novosphingobium sp. Rr 2-17]|uniref:methyl-accepting chemotaxis protein n=1 Tax=Novosphingobium sp. Rr 2-17 TaxID=555793 RepID=UPI0002699209|nr:methyl-accepting chemotaxis protein [Novosphingobium sp. Rr 2-17]EIZ78691.1 methyl-accepting chemotaxis sensory transducer [Novosphingobium sp. Rr 2-17]